MTINLTAARDTYRYMDNGTARDVVVVPFDAEGNMGDFVRIGSALDWMSAVLLVSEMGYRIARTERSQRRLIVIS